MNVTLDLTPHIERRLKQEAAARGVSVETYLTTLIEHGSPVESPHSTPEEFEADMDRLAEGSERLPVLPDEAYTRESIYADHD